MLRTKLDQARDSVAVNRLSLKQSEAELALAICDEAKLTVIEVSAKLEPLEKLAKELPTRASLDNTERKRQVAKMTTEIRGQLKKLETTIVEIQNDWQKDAR